MKKLLVTLFLALTASTSYSLSFENESIGPLVSPTTEGWTVSSDLVVTQGGVDATVFGQTRNIFYADGRVEYNSDVLGDKAVYSISNDPQVFVSPAPGDTLRFFYNALNDLTVYVPGVETLTISTTPLCPSVQSSCNWVEAVLKSPTLFNTFSLNGAAFGWAVDGITITTATSVVSPIPEPSGYLLLLAGMGAIGFLKLSRKQEE